MDIQIKKTSSLEPDPTSMQAVQGIGVFEHTDWYKALTLLERRNAIQRLRDEHNPLLIDWEFANKRLEKWMAQSWFVEEGVFAERLKAEHFTKETFLEVLGVSTESLRQSFHAPPAWLKALETAYLHPLAETVSNKLLEEPSFLSLVEPLFVQGLLRLRGGIKKLTDRFEDVPFDSSTVEEIVSANLPGRLLPVVMRTLILEVNVARLRGQLTGDTPQERQKSFFHLLGQRDFALNLLQEYPVLARQALRCIDSWVSGSLEFLRHLCEDWANIKAMFSPEEAPGVLTGLSSGAGDTHRGGRSVSIAEFESGFKTVYKPRSMAVDVHFQNLLRWINEHGDHPYRTLSVLDRDTHGWVEFAARKTCESPDELKRFYTRQGGLIALLFVLEATDFHYENIIAAGEHPVLIDLESLFHPRVRENSTNTSPIMPGHRMMNRSVLRMGILPQRIWQTKEDLAGIDISGLNTPVGKLSPFALPMVEKEDTDEIHVVRKRMDMQGSQNMPVDEAVNLGDYVEELTTGFEQVYRMLLEHRDEFGDKEGPLAAFASCEVRVILRGTAQYARILSESHHPDMLRNALDRDRIFDALWPIVKQQPQYAEITPFEQMDLWKEDIPFFTTRPDTATLFTSRGVHLAGFYEKTGLEAVRACLARLSKEDLKRQLWFIWGSIAASEQGLGERRWPSYQPERTPSLPKREQLLEAAKAVGDHLEFLALQDDEHDLVSWLGLTLIGEEAWMLAPAAVDLYSGLPGITLFLAYLGAVTGEERYTRLARRGQHTIQESIPQLVDMTTIGAFEGWGALIYLYAHLSKLWADETLLEKSESLVERIAENVETDEVFDIIGGAAGGILSLLSLYEVLPSERILEVTTICGDRLLATAHPMQQGLGWPKEGEEALAGFSHGNAGIAAALIKLAARTGEPRFYEAGLQAMAYERSLFSEEVGNWPDLRELDTWPGRDEPIYVTAWCHGAVGIGLGRLGILPLLDEQAAQEALLEITTAIATTLREGFGGNHSICHGDLGNLELLLMASEILQDTEIPRETVPMLTGMILDSIQRNGWLCGVPLGIETPGLMTGISGIGYELLRLAVPDQVPSVLAVESPR